MDENSNVLWIVFEGITVALGELSVDRQSIELWNEEGGMKMVPVSSIVGAKIVAVSPR
jgi:hypothetical protein